MIPVNRVYDYTSEIPDPILFIFVESKLFLVIKILNIFYCIYKGIGDEFFQLRNTFPKIHEKAKIPKSNQSQNTSRSYKSDK
jgi:hypothetical protein